MNRAEKRRKQKLAQKAVKKANHVQPAPPPPPEQPQSIQQSLETAIQHHTAGRLAEAQSIYQQILQADPNQPEVLHLLGVISLQGGKLETAIDLITKAVTIKPDFAEALSNLGAAHRGHGNLDEAVASYQKAVSCKPDYADAHYNLGNTLKQSGRTDEAIASFRKMIAINPGFAEAHNNLGNALTDVGLLDEAVASFKQALALKPGYAKAHNNLGTALYELGEFVEAEDQLYKALAIDPVFVEALNNLGNTLMKLDRLDEAVTSYVKALTLKPNDAGTRLNLAEALKHQGKHDEAIQTLQDGLKKETDNNLLVDSLTEILNYHIPQSGISDTYTKAQEALKQVEIKESETDVIPDETIENLFQQCHSILTSHGLEGYSVESQIWRGIIYDPGCTRHMKIFDTLNVIPEFCFGCYKVSIEPSNVVELFKLMLVFDDLKLPNDNTRKCFVEVRPKISGTYKGLIYCQNLEDARQTEQLVRPIVNQRISSDLAVLIKRGCSEYPPSYPEYSQFDDNGIPTMAYKEEWRDQEDYADKNLIEHKYPPAFHSHNHSGFTLRDALVMRTWLGYAETVGDASYLTISGSPVQGLQVKRPVTIS